MRRIFLVALLCISSYPVDGSYAIDPVSCNPLTTGPLMEAELQRAATLAKFMSLNLANDNRRNPATNPQGWYYDNYVRAQVALLMGDGYDAYVFSTETFLFYCSSTCYVRLKSQIRLESECLVSSFQVPCFIHEHSIAYSLSRLDQAQWVLGGAQGTAGVGIAGVSQTKIDKSQAGPDDEVPHSERQI